MSTADTAHRAHMATTVEAALPLLGPRITAAPIELRGIADDLLGPLADLAVEGISPRRAAVPDSVEDRARRRTCLVSSPSTTGAEFSSDRWAAPLAVLWDGEPVGVQEKGSPSRTSAPRYRAATWFRHEHPLLVTGLVAVRRSTGLDAQCPESLVRRQRQAGKTAPSK